MTNIRAVARIPWWAWLCSMTLIAWECLRHPTKTSWIDLTNGRLVSRS